MLSSPQDDLNNLINDIPVHNESKTEHGNTVIGLDRIQGSNISIGDGCDGVDSPI